MIAQELGSHRILVVVPGVILSDALPRFMETTARLELRIAERFADPCTALPADTEVLRYFAGGGHAVVRKQAIASGDNLAKVVAVRDIRTGLPAVAFRLNAGAGVRLAKATQNNIEQSLAFVLDNQIIAMPTIRQPIAGGPVLLSGGLMAEQASELAMHMRAGWLPPRLTVVVQEVFQPEPR